MSPAKGKSYAWPVPGPRRQRRPPAIAAAVSPGHPGRSPNRVRRPAPAQAMVLKPPAIVERRPAPRITREPVPPAIGINPAATITVWTPRRVCDYHRRLPARTVAGNVNPRPIRDQRVVEGGIPGICRRGRQVLNRRIVSGRRRLYCHFGWRRGCHGLRRVQAWVAWPRGSLAGRGVRSRRRLQSLWASRQSLQRLVALNHRGDHCPWYANVVKINDLLNPKIERARRVRDESHHHALLHT